MKSVSFFNWIWCWWLTMRWDSEGRTEVAYQCLNFRPHFVRDFVRDFAGDIRCKKQKQKTLKTKTTWNEGVIGAGGISLLNAWTVDEISMKMVFLPAASFVSLRFYLKSVFKFLKHDLLSGVFRSVRSIRRTVYGHRGILFRGQNCPASDLTQSLSTDL